LRGQFPAGEPHIHGYFLDRPFTVGPRQVGALLLRTFNYSDQFAPAGKTVIQASFDSDWDYWAGLRGDQLAYDAEKRRVAGEVLDRLERHYPGISGQVEVTDVATPYTTWRHTRNWRGAYEGWLPTPKQMMTPLHRTLPGLERFVMAGQWVVPGGGVPISIASGRDAARILCAKDGVEFRLNWLK
jgi:phytoene dehydrogenase-like protein